MSVTNRWRFPIILACLCVCVCVCECVDPDAHVCAIICTVRKAIVAGHTAA